MHVRSKKFLPVIHCVDPQKKNGIQHAIRNTRIAVANNADGVFLIGHTINYLDLVDIYRNVRKDFPDTWIGVNFLDLPHKDNWGHLADVAWRCEGLNALWTDGLPNEKLLLHDTTDVYGSVAFKYINPNQNGVELQHACEQASMFVDVVTTSGDKTGSPPEILKLKTMRHHLPLNISLALASGISEENVISFLPYVDKFLVASSIAERDLSQSNQEYLIPERVEKLAYLIHA